MWELGDWREGNVKIESLDLSQISISMACKLELSYFI
jgi:hypothetical protein